MDVIRYNSTLKNEWDTFVRKAKNSTFLFMRDYMDYHSDRFADYSLMFYERGKLCALLPANFSSTDSTVFSHQGLTYGGFILSRDIKGNDVFRMFVSAIDKMKQDLGITKIIYKPLPQMYSSVPSQEDLYVLFRLGAKLVSRSLSSVVNNRDRVNFTILRNRKIKKADKNGFVYKETEAFDEFWQILSEVLAARHKCKPVHTLSEMELLHNLFSSEIKLYAAFKEGKMYAGCIVYETSNVAHVQYIASSPEGKDLCALDGLFDYLFKNRYSSVNYIDFGISTENGGMYLNEGLLFQKEGFGGRGVVYDIYELNV